MILVFRFTVLMIFLAVGASLDAGSGFEDARPGRILAFPQDHGKHPGFQTEWWYFTGNLNSNGRLWGFQLTFFRRSMMKERVKRNSAWAVRDLYPAHFALTDISGRRFHHAEILSREGPGLAQASPQGLNVSVKDWSAQQHGDEIHIKARQNGCALDLRLKPLKPLVLQGDHGFSRKGGTGEQASYYYSFTRLQAEGTVTFKGISHKVAGLAWMDHEFGSSILLEDQAGWDWFSLQLDDGSEIMVFQLRKRDGSGERPFGTLVPAAGRPKSLEGRQIVISVTDVWTSSRTGATYPSGWSVDIPSEKIRLTIAPLFEDQELVASKSTGVVYWEGAVKVNGSANGLALRGRGYVELTGYAHSMAGRL
ncbi:MAG: lipocalin-like domain-containing protein [Pseudomonadota bacterium]